jgi:F0F1-type ATP synthase membrane subunit b/b'
VAELEARAAAEIAGLASRSGDELRGEISRHASRAIDLVVAESITESTHQQLIEDFIAKVGASGGPAGNGASS